MTQRQYHANGKFLLTGEYVVLHGALALALPTRLGQSLTVETFPETSPKSIETFQETSLRWDAFTPSGPWFSATFDCDTLGLLACDDPQKGQRLASVLQAVVKQQPGAFHQAARFETRLDFDPAWGLGSSSTLIANLARWAGINPYQLLHDTFGGSGYDIACATADTPVFYQLRQGQPVAEPAGFDPPFKEHLFFVYSGRKQSSFDEVRGFNKSFDPHDHLGDIEFVSGLSRKLPALTALRDFRECLDAHEEALGILLQRLPVKKRFFNDFEGSVKSLGAWGGDFLLAATEWPCEKVTNYFRSKGLHTILKYQDIIL